MTQQAEKGLTGEEIESISTEKNNRLVMIDKVLYVQSTDVLYTLDGRRAQ